MLEQLTFLTPLGGLLALAVALPLLAFARSSAKASRLRTLLRLEAPESRSRLTLAMLAAVPLLLGLAAAGPALRDHVKRRVRTDAQAVFVFDISRSMLASVRRGSPTRLAQAMSAAIQLRNGPIGDVPSGIATFTTLLLPHLFPTASTAVFDSTVKSTISSEQPLPPYLAPGFPGTSFSALGPLRDQGYFSPSMKKRVVVLLTDGESGPYDPQELGQTLVGTDYTDPAPGEPNEPAQAPISLFIVRIGNATDRIYHRNGSVEAAYRPDPHTSEIISTLAANTDAQVFDASQLSATDRELRRVIGSGPTMTMGQETTTRDLGPYIALAALLSLVVVIRNRNFASI
jgi:hypothetical protein